MKFTELFLVKTPLPEREVWLEVFQTLGLLLAAQLVVNGLLISFLRDELILLPKLSSSGLLNLAFCIIALCSVLSIVRTPKTTLNPHGN